MNDDELRELLRQWEAPAVPPALERKILAKPPVFIQWFRWLLTGTVRIPVPAAICVVCILAFFAWRASKPAAADLSDFQQVNEFKPRVVSTSHDSAWRVGFSLSLLFFADRSAAAIQSGGASSDNGVYVQYEMKLEPPVPPITSYGGGVAVEKNVIKRHIVNYANKTYFGYDLTAEPAGEGRYRLRFAPLTITPEFMRQTYKGTSGWSSLALPTQPVTHTIRAGETIALDLFVNPSTGQKLIDYLRVKSDSRQSVTVEGAARDFTPADAEIALSDPAILIDGKPFGKASRGGVSGSAVWIDIDGHGRFVFSLAPRPDLGLRRAGEIRGTTMTWRSGPSTYVIETDKPIASGTAAYHLYVFHDPSYRPPGHDNLDPGWIGMSAGPKPDAAFRRK